jgi:hypothetical protein
MISTITAAILPYLVVGGIGGAIGYGVWWLLPARSRIASRRR